jgi:hypothetical protein
MEFDDRESCQTLGSSGYHDRSTKKMKKFAISGFNTRWRTFVAPAGLQVVICHLFRAHDVASRVSGASLQVLINVIGGGENLGR